MGRFRCRYNHVSLYLLIRSRLQKLVEIQAAFYFISQISGQISYIQNFPYSETSDMILGPPTKLNKKKHKLVKKYWRSILERQIVKLFSFFQFSADLECSGKCFKVCYLLRQLLKVLIITNLQHAVSKIWIYGEPESTTLL